PPAALGTDTGVVTLCTKEFAMSDRGDHRIKPVEDTMREGNADHEGEFAPRDKKRGSNAVGVKGMMLVKVIVLLAGMTIALGYLAGRTRAQRSDDRGRNQREGGFDSQISGNAQRMMEEGKRIFRFDTFGDEVFWTDTLKLHRASEGAKL